MLGKCSFLKVMQLTLLELALVLKSAIYFFFMATKAQQSQKVDIALMKIIKKGFEHICYIYVFQKMICF